MGAIRTGHGEQALPAGLAARTLVGSISGAFAQAKVGELTGVQFATDDAVAAWARAAELAFTELEASGSEHVHSIAALASALVGQWQAPHPAASELLDASFDARLGDLAAELDRQLDVANPADPTALRRAVDQVTRHRSATTSVGRPRAQRAQLAARLVSWTRDPSSAGHGTGVDSPAGPLLLTTSVGAYSNDGAWVDAARRRVGEGDDSPPRFADVLRRISTEAHARRATGNRAFAEALSRWTTDGTAPELAGSTVVAVEAVLADVVAPLAKQQPVLLVVLDGCGLPAFLEPVDQFRQFALDEIGADGVRQVGLAALPTVTEVSRTSLLTGGLRTGGAAEEKKFLPQNDAIAKLGGPPAAVFHHRQDLVTGVGQGLPAAVLQALTPDGPRVVATVVNTIDDELSRGDFTPEYRLEFLGPLASLLRAAVDAGRLVIVTADHGHVLGVGLDGKGQVAKSGEGGDRSRAADRAPSDDEVVLRGPRVLKGDTAGVLAPWHDDLRYSAKHGGYHGGATPDECVVPLSVFLPSGVPAPKGWEPVVAPSPTWWDLHVEAAAEPEPTAKRPRRRKAAAPEATDGQSSLFGEPAAKAPAVDVPALPVVSAVPTGSAAPWADALLSSELYASQLGLVGRAKPPEDRVRATLGALHARGGVASFAVIAQATGMPAARVQFFLAPLANVLNVDGYPVLTVDAQAQEARLDEGLLGTQFLGGAS